MTAENVAEQYKISREDQDEFALVSQMRATKAIKEVSPKTKVFVGGAPLSQEYSDKIGADGYFPDPNKFAKYLAKIG